MCGIHGIITGSKGEHNGDDFLKSAFVANTLRGMDAAGLAVIDHEQKVFDLYKLPIAGQFFLETKGAKELFMDSRKPYRASIGHVRHATSGGHSIETAHPFECWNADETNSLVGVHNGTLTGWSTKPNGKYYSVDSEWALNHILTEQFDAFEDFTGAFCFVWWDDKDSENLNIALNKERPMHVVMLEDGGMAYASEAGMLYWLLERHGVKMQLPVLELTPDHWYKFPIKDPTKFTKKALPKAKSTYTPPAGNAYQPSYKSAVTVVTDILNKYKDTATKPTGTAVVPIKNAKVSDAQFRAALKEGILHERVTFVPVGTFSGGTEGVVTIGGFDLNAQVVGYTPKNIDDDHSEWECAVIGLDESVDGEPTVLLDTPFLLTKPTTVH